MTERESSIHPKSFRISLCMIAKNEESFIGDCLASVEGFVDEIIVADTGSTDGTVAIAQSFGAKVIDFPWIDDFAAARNAALEHATGDWVLLLDCDERIVRDTIPDCLAAIADDQFDCGMIPFYSSNRLDASISDVLSGKALLDEPSMLPRLFRRTPQLRWEGIVHEAPNEFLADPKMRSIVLPGVIVHYGDVPSHREALNKLERNRQLLERRIDAEPLDVVAWVYLGEERYRLGDIDGSREAFKVAWEQFEDQWLVHCTGVGTKRTSKMLLRTFIEKASIAWMLIEVQSNDFEAARRIALRCREWDISNPTLNYLSAVCFERFALLTRNESKRHSWLVSAIDSLRLCLDERKSLRAIAPLEGMTTWRVSNKLGEVLLQLGEAKQAIDLFETALGFRPDLLEAQFGLAEAHLDLGQTREAIRRLEILVHHDCTDGPLLMAAALRREGRWQEAEQHFDRAYQLVRVSLMAAYRARRLNAMLQERAPVLA